MALSDVIARLAVELSMETAAFEKGATLAEKRMEQSRKRFEAIGKKMVGIGKTMSVAVTAPLVALGYASVKAAQESAEALGQVDAALKSMGDGAGRTAEQLKALASKQMRRSLYDDDEILRKVTANLLTFGSVAGDNFDRAQQAAIDLSARLGQDLQQSTIMVGKALNDPIKGLSALRRVGIQFTEQQEEQIKKMVEFGDVAGAQAIMLGELERQFGGAAQAMRDADPTAAAKMSWAEFQETIGEKLLPILPVVAGAIIRVLDAFSGLSPAMQKTVVIGAAVAAALGPLLTIFGGLITIGAPLLAFMKTIGVLMLSTGTAAGAATVGVATLGSVLGSLAAVALPIAAIAAAGYLAWKNWDDIAPRLQPLIDQLTAIGEGLGLVEGKAGRTRAELAKDEGWREFGSNLKGVTDGIQSFLDAGDAFSLRFAATMREFYANAARYAPQELFTRMAASAIDAAARLYSGVKSWLQDRLGAVFDWVRGKVAAVGDAFHDLYMRVVGNSDIPDMVDGIAAHMARLDAVMVAPIEKATSKAAKAVRDMAGEVRGLLDRLFPEVRAALDFRGAAKLIDGSGLSKAERDAAHGRLLAEALGNSSGPWNPFPGQDLGAEELGGAGMERAANDWDRMMARLSKASEDARVRIAKSFKDAANETISSLSSLTSAIKGGGFLNILESLIGLGLQLGSIGAFGKTIASNINRSVPGYAGGTNFHPGGLALVGERGPELVSMPRGSRVTPNNKMGGGNTYYFNGNLMTEEFWARINAGDMGAAQGGMMGALATSSYRSSRRVA